MKRKVRKYNNKKKKKLGCNIVLMKTSAALIENSDAKTVLQISSGFQ